MHDYTTIIGVIELRLHKISYDNVQKRYRIGRSGISLIMERYRDSGLSLDERPFQVLWKLKKLI